MFDGCLIYHLVLASRVSDWVYGLAVSSFDFESFCRCWACAVDAIVESTAQSPRSHRISENQL